LQNQEISFVKSKVLKYLFSTIRQDLFVLGFESGIFELNNLGGFLFSDQFLPVWCQS
jgi:hypothetical protein